MALQGLLDFDWSAPCKVADDEPLALKPDAWVNVTGYRCRIKFAHPEGPDAVRLTLEYVHPTPVNGPWMVITVRRVDGGWWFGQWEVTDAEALA